MKKSNLMLHCGGVPVEREGLDHFAMPEKTETYTPVGHYPLVMQVLTMGQDLMKGFTLASESYGVAREGAQMFGLVTFKNSNTEMGLSIGFRNSYDKSMSIGIAAGSNVFVCDNLALRGDISIMRKHTGDVWSELQERLISVCYHAGKTFTEIEMASDRMKMIALNDRRAFETMGVLYGEGIISPRQLTTVKAEWLRPAHEAFAPRNAWSLYNACTEALKTSPPAAVMENHVNLSRFFDSALVIDAEYEVMPSVDLAPVPVVPTVLM